MGKSDDPETMLSEDIEINTNMQQTVSGSNTDGSYTRAISNLFLSPLEKNPIAADLG